jgi:murein L,D-transpeptidase YafK
VLTTGPTRAPHEFCSGLTLVTAILLRKFASALVLVWIALTLAACGGLFGGGGDNRHNQPLAAATVQALRAIGSSPGAGMVIRIFKQEEVLEVWKQTGSGEYRMLKTFEICSYSGDLGPKFAEGDRQSPEGFYTISPGLMNPRSNFYLAFNTGFPNKFDRAHGRTGSNLMVHGDCRSVGCYAMTDEGIAEIYALARETFKGGNPSFQLQIFPFRMTTANLAANAASQHLPFWQDIKEGYDLFDLNKTPPLWDVCEGQYVFDANGSGALDPLGPCPPQVFNAALADRQAADARVLANYAATVQSDLARQEAIRARGEAIGGFINGVLGGAPTPPAQPAI